MSPMPQTRTSTPRAATPVWLTRLVYLCAILSTILWLAPLFSSHPILFPHGKPFIDITVYKGRFTLYHSAKFFTSRAFSGFAYPAGAAPIYALFYRFADPINTYFLLAAAVSFLALITLFVYLRSVRATHLFLPLLLATSYPLVFLIQRANIELILWFLTALALIAAYRRFSIPSAFLIGLAAAIKLYPIFLLGLFLRRKRDLPAFFIGIATAIVAYIAALAYTGPTLSIAAQGFIHGVDRFQDKYVDTPSVIEVAFDHCLLAPLKFLSVAHHTPLAISNPTYYALAGTLALLLFLRIRTLPFLNRAVFLVVAMVALPPVSFEYTLTHLYVPTFLLLGALAVLRSGPPLTATLSLTLLLFLLLPFAGVSTLTPIPTGPIQSFVLLALLILPAITPWPTTTPDAA